MSSYNESWRGGSKIDISPRLAVTLSKWWTLRGCDVESYLVFQKGRGWKGGSSHCPGQERGGSQGRIGVSLKKFSGLRGSGLTKCNRNILISSYSSGGVIFKPRSLLPIPVSKATSVPWGKDLMTTTSRGGSITCSVGGRESPSRGINTREKSRRRR
jgi:hypothetical protein